MWDLGVPMPVALMPDGEPLVSFEDWTAVIGGILQHGESAASWGT